MIKKKLALWLVLILVLNLFSGMAAFSDTPDPVLPVEPVQPVVIEPIVESPVTSGSAVRSAEIADVPESEIEIPDISVVSSEAELNAVDLDKTADFFVVQYSNGVQEIRKKSITMMAELKSEAEAVPSTEELIALYEDKQEVSFAAPIVIYHIAEGEAAAVPVDPDYTNGNLWGFNAVKANRTFGSITTSSMAAVVVAVVDSGVNWLHQDIDDAIYTVNGQKVANDYIDNDPNTLDQNGHGTHVAGTIAAEANNIDIIGVAAGVKIMPVRVLDAQGSGSNVNVAAGINWAVANGAKIINLSLGGSDIDPVVTEAVDDAIAAGAVVVAASGNGRWEKNDLNQDVYRPGDNFGINGSEPGVNVKPMLYPAALPQVLSVGSIGMVFDNGQFTGKYRLSNFSCAVTTTSMELDVCAPGEDINSLIHTGTTGITEKGGTSMATPHVSALAALLKAQDMNRSPAWIIDRIKSTTQVGVYNDATYYDNLSLQEKFYGKGLVDCVAALGAFNPSVLSVTTMSSLPSTIATLKVEENIAGAHLIHMGKPFTFKLPSGYQWSTLPTVNMSGGFSGTTGSVSALNETLTLIPNYSGATTASTGIISLTGAQVNATSSSAVKNLYIEISGDPLVTTASLKASDLVGNYLSSIALSGVNLSPNFNSTLQSYTAVVGNNVTTSSMTALPAFSGANIAMTVNGANYTSGSFNLREGDNVIVISVTSFGETRTYQVIVNREVSTTPGTITVDGNGGTQLMLPSNPSAGTYTFNITTSSATLDLGSPSGNAVTVTPSMNFITSANNVSVSVLIPSNVTVTGPGGWDGKIDLPEIKESTGANLSQGTALRIVEVGLPGEEVTFSKPVKITIPGMAGKSVKWFRPGVSATEITKVLSQNTEGAAIAELVGGVREGKINSGSDLVIWTTHFTEFIAYEPYVAPVDQPVLSGGGGGGGGGGSTTDVMVNGTTKVELPALSFELPANVFHSNFQLKVGMTSFIGLKMDEGVRILSDMWSIQPDALVAFQKPCKLTMNYAPSKVDLAKEKVSLYWLDEKTKKWSELDNVSASSGKVTGVTQKHGVFAILVSPKAPDSANILSPVVSPEAIVTLTDIKGHWANASIQKLIALKAISGNPDGTFQPEKQVTRAEFITMLVKALGLKGTSDRTFSDLQGHWASGAVSTAVANGIVNGFSDGTVAPDALITREQMAVMIVKALKLSNGKTDKMFGDAASISPWATDAIATAMSNGIIGGYADGTFKPQGMATKAEAVTIIAKGIK